MARPVPPAQTGLRLNYIMKVLTVVLSIQIVLKIRYCEKATKFQNQSGRFFRFFVICSEYLNFNSVGKYIEVLNRHRLT